MTNREKYKDEIIDIAMRHDVVGIEKTTYKPFGCFDMEIDCTKCLLHRNHKCDVGVLKKWAEELETD